MLVDERRGSFVLVSGWFVDKHRLTLDHADPDEKAGGFAMSVEDLHPGALVRHECLERSGLSVTAGAEILGVADKHSQTC